MRNLIGIIVSLCFASFVYAGGVEVSGGRSVSLKTSDGVIVEDVYPSIVVTQLDHWMTHVGTAYTSSDTISILTGATYKFLIKNVVDTGTHMTRFSFESTQADAEVIFYEGSTIEANGTEVTPRNNNRQYPDASSVQVFTNASTSALGTQLEHDIIAGSKQSGGSGGDVDEWIFKQYTTYVITYTNNNAQTDVVSYHFDFLETGLLP